MKAYTLGLYEKAMPNTLSWEEKLDCAKEAGYDFVEISIDETDAKLSRLEWSAQQRHEMLSLTCRKGITIDTMCLSSHRKYPIGSLDAAGAARSMEVMEKAIILSKDLGIRIIQLAGYDVYYEQPNPETRIRFEENLKRAVSMAEAAGVILAFETMETAFMDTVWKAMFYVKKIESPYLQIYPDIGNLTNAALLYNKSVPDDILSGKGHICATHIKETAPGHYREIPFGTGHVDFDTAILAAWNAGCRKFVTEFWYMQNEDWRKDIQHNKKFADDIFGRLHLS